MQTAISVVCSLLNFPKITGVTPIVALLWLQCSCDYQLCDVLARTFLNFASDCPGMAPPALILRVLSGEQRASAKSFCNRWPTGKRGEQPES